MLGSEMCFTLTSGCPIMPMMCQAHYRPSVKLYLPEPVISACQILSQEKCMPWHQHYTSTLRELSDLKLGSTINQSIEGRSGCRAFKSFYLHLWHLQSLLSPRSYSQHPTIFSIPSLPLPFPLPSAELYQPHSQESVQTFQGDNLFIWIH